MERPGARRSPLRGLREVLETVLLAAGIYVAVQALVPPYAVDGASMDPALRDGERLLVNRSVYAHFDANQFWNLLPGVDRSGEAIVYPFHPPERGDIVVFQPPVRSERPYIKRVIGLPGDEVSFAAGRVLINGQPLAEPYLGPTETYCVGDPHCRLIVPAGQVYVLGDNRGNSSDSRLFGPVGFDAIIGQAWLANWPLDRFGLIPVPNYDGE